MIGDALNPHPQWRRVAPVWESFSVHPALYRPDPIVAFASLLRVHPSRLGPAAMNSSRFPKGSLA
jgi:hypothetical protein